MIVRSKENKMKTLDKGLIEQEGGISGNGDRLPRNYEENESRKEITKTEYFTLQKLRTYRCEVKVE